MLDTSKGKKLTCLIVLENERPNDHPGSHRDLLAEAHVTREPEGTSLSQPHILQFLLSLT